MQAKKVPVIIIGGGPAGLALAAQLIHRGISCRIFERRSRADLLQDTNSFYDMSASGLQALLRVADGIAAPAVFEAACAYEKLALYKGNSHIADIEWKSRGLGMPLFNITRAALLKALVEAVEKMDPKVLCFESSAKLVDEEAGTVEVMMAGDIQSQLLQADLVVAADGIHSRVRKHIFGDTGLRSDGIVAYYAVLPPLTPEEDKRIERPNSSTAQNFGICGMDADFIQYAVVNKTATIWYANFVLDGKPYLSLPSNPNGWLAEAKKRCEGRIIPAVEFLMAKTKEEDLQVVACCDRKPLDSFSKGKVVLVGDAAHPFTPYAGLGASQAMVDAFCLGEALAECKDRPEEAVKQFEMQRIKGSNQLMEESRYLCQPTFSYWLLFHIYFLMIRVANWFGKADMVADAFMSLDLNTLVNNFVPFKNEKEKLQYEKNHKAGLMSLKSQLATPN